MVLSSKIMCEALRYIVMCLWQIHGENIETTLRVAVPVRTFLLTCAAEYILHIRIASSRPALPVDQLAQLQQIIHAERRATG